MAHPLATRPLSHTLDATQLDRESRPQVEDPPVRPARRCKDSGRGLRCTIFMPCRSRLTPHRLSTGR